MKEKLMSHMTPVVVAAVLVGCSSTPVSDADARAGVVVAANSWAQAFNDCNPEKLATLYLPDAVLWGTVSQTVISTPAGVRQYFDRACAATPQFKVSFGEQLVRVYGDAANNSGTYTFSRTVDGQLRSGPARYSFTYRNVNGTWLIADHHSSLVPAAPPASSPGTAPAAR